MHGLQAAIRRGRPREGLGERGAISGRRRGVAIGVQPQRQGAVLATQVAGRERVIEAGAEDMQDEGDVFEIFTSPDAFEAVSDALKAAGVETQAAEISMIPQNYIALTGDDARKMMKLYDALDDNDDVQKVYANFDIDESEME